MWKAKTKLKGRVWESVSPNWGHFALNLRHFYMFCPQIEGTFYVSEGTWSDGGGHGPLGLPFGSAPVSLNKCFLGSFIKADDLSPCVTFMNSRPILSPHPYGT